MTAEADPSFGLSPYGLSGHGAENPASRYYRVRLLETARAADGIKETACDVPRQCVCERGYSRKRLLPALVLIQRCLGGEGQVKRVHTYCVRGRRVDVPRAYHSTTVFFVVICTFSVRRSDVLACEVVQFHGSSIPIVKITRSRKDMRSPRTRNITASRFMPGARDRGRCAFKWYKIKSSRAERDFTVDRPPVQAALMALQ